MNPRTDDALVQIRDVLLETYAVNDAMNQLSARAPRPTSMAR